MEMTYESFVETLRSELLEATGYDEEMICYKQETEYPPTSGDRLLLKRQRNEEIMEVCALYVQDLYREYQNGWSMEAIVREIVEQLDAIARSECFQRSRNLEDYDKIKEDLFIRLLNIEKNQVELEDCIYRTIGDIAVYITDIWCFYRSRCSGRQERNFICSGIYPARCSRNPGIRKLFRWDRSPGGTYRRIYHRIFIFRTCDVGDGETSW